MANKRKSKFNSLSSPGVKQDLSNYLTELAFLRQNHGNKLPPKFWQQTRYKFRYRKEIMAVRRFIKNYGEPAVLRIALANHIYSWTDFAKVEFLLQKDAEAKARAAEPKDTTSVGRDFIPEINDLRGHVASSSPRRGLFDRLKELENGEKEDR